MRCRRAAAGVSALLLLQGCSAFNMTPPCSDMVEGISLSLIPNSMVPTGGQIDRARVAAIVSVSDLQEIGGGYNTRMCRATIALRDGSARASTVVQLDQAEGARHWVVVKFTTPDDPDLARVVALVRRAYVSKQ
jgi:hypothetical protein